MDATLHRRWIEHLRHAAGAPNDTAPLGLGALEDPLRAALGLGGVVTRAPGNDADEVRLWRAVRDVTIDPASIVAMDADGPLLMHGAYRAIEVWTDAELSALHALWRLARACRRPAWRRRVERARAWHVEHTQPDNATNRPWALHVFLLGDTPETTHYAETLLQNAIALDARPTPLGAALLRDAAHELEAAGTC